MAKKIALTTVISLALLAGMAQAQGTSWSGGIWGATGSDGVSPLSGILVALVDNGGDGWQGLQYDQPAPTDIVNTDTYQWDPADTVLEVVEIANGEGYYGTAGLNTNDYDAGAPVWMLVFEGGTLGSPGEQTPYAAFLAPEVAPSYDQYHTHYVDGSGMSMPLETTPEPTSMLLMLAGGGLVALRRRRNRA